MNPSQFRASHHCWVCGPYLYSPSPAFDTTIIFMHPHLTALFLASMPAHHLVIAGCYYRRSEKSQQQHLHHYQSSQCGRLCLVCIGYRRTILDEESNTKKVRMLQVIHSHTALISFCYLYNPNAPLNSLKANPKAYPKQRLSLNRELVHRHVIPMLSMHKR